MAAFVPDVTHSLRMDRQIPDILFLRKRKAPFRSDQRSRQDKLENYSSIYAEYCLLTHDIEFPLLECVQSHLIPLPSSSSFLLLLYSFDRPSSDSSIVLPLVQPRQRSRTFRTSKQSTDLMPSLEFKH